MTSRADALLAGPRGRRLCLALVQQATGPQSWPQSTWRDRPVGHRTDSSVLARVQDQLVDRVGALDLGSVAQPERLLDALLESVDQARYWQPPDDADQLLADPTVAAALGPVAEAVAAAPAAQWWSAPLAAGDQHAVAFSHDDQPPAAPPTGGVRGALQRWRERAELEEERHRGHWSTDPAESAGGPWWSVPALTDVPTTSRSVLGIGSATGRDLPAPAGLVLVEDEMGWPTARSWVIDPPASARVYEITGPDAWTALVARHPLDVTAARRGTWWSVTGWDGAWEIPDWAAVAESYDAVHLTVDGYLATATRALPVPDRDAATVLGGAGPDATWWLTDLPVPGPSVTWRRQDGDLPRWTLG